MRGRSPPPPDHTTPPCSGDASVSDQQEDQCRGCPPSPCISSRGPYGHRPAVQCRVCRSPVACVGHRGSSLDSDGGWIRQRGTFRRLMSLPRNTPSTTRIRAMAQPVKVIMKPLASRAATTSTPARLAATAASATTAAVSATCVRFTLGVCFIPHSWEGDLLCGSKNSYIVTLVERHTRYVMLAKISSRDTQTVINALIKQAKKLPDHLYQSLTWDRGVEMADHKRFTMATDIQVYFCDPQSPWQRGSNENTNRLLRQYFPKKTDLSVHRQARLNYVARELNERPRDTRIQDAEGEISGLCCVDHLRRLPLADLREYSNRGNRVAAQRMSAIGQERTVGLTIRRSGDVVQPMRLWECGRFITPASAVASEPQSPSLGRLADMHNSCRHNVCRPNCSWAELASRVVSAVPVVSFKTKT